MKKPSSITTCYGDTGFTKLCSGERVRKTDSRVRACGDVDELVCVLGIARAFLRNPKLRRDLEMLQRDLFRIGSEVATTAKHRTKGSRYISQNDVTALDRLCAFWDGRSIMRDFVIPGNSRAGAFLDLARAVARRCERQLVDLHQRKLLRNVCALAWINRLSDLLWLMARAAERRPTPLHSGRHKS